MLFLYLLLLILGLVLLVKGADFFVDGSSKIASYLHIPSLIIGLTLVSIGTSAPELSVSITSAIKGTNSLSFGNVIGSNIFNVLGVVGISAIVIPLVIPKSVLKLDIPILVGIYLILILFGFIISPLKLELWESIIIFALFFIYTGFLIFRGKKEAKDKEDIEEEKPSKKDWFKNIAFVILGAAAIVAGGQFVVNASSYIAKKCGMDEVLIGLTIVAIGTSLPELVTSVVAAKKGENDIALGNAIGSCIFNVILILGVSSTIRSLTMEWSYLVDVIVMLGAVIICFLFSLRKQKIGRIQGLILVLLYVAYTVYIIARNYVL